MIEILGHSSASEATEPARIRDLPAVAVLSRRAVPLAFIVLMAGTTMLFSMVLGPLITHHHYWIIPGDIWGTFRTSQFVAWGDIGNVYSSGGGLVSLPGISVVLAPAALIVNHFKMSLGFPVGIPHPSSWLLLGPYEAVVGSVVLFALDSLAEYLGLNRGARLVSTACEAVVLWPVVVIWGHPEDHSRWRSRSGVS